MSMQNEDIKAFMVNVVLRASCFRGQHPKQSQTVTIAWGFCTEHPNAIIALPHAKEETRKRIWTLVPSVYD